MNTYIYIHVTRSGISVKFNEHFTSSRPNLARHIPHVAEHPIECLHDIYVN